MKHLFLSLFLAFSAIYTAHANNIAITNVTISGQNDALNFKLINFDLTWDNSWNINGGPQNWDAAWVFVKYRLKTNNVWHHATLNYVNGTGTADGHTEPVGSNIASSNDNNFGAHGVFIHAAGVFSQGTATYNGVQLRWNYGTDGLGDGDNVEVSVTGIEMVYVPQGSFYVGSGGEETGAFYTHPNTTVPYYISSEAAITVGTEAGNLYYPNNGDQVGPIPASFPKGHSAFYCMKYEITQSQYVAFLNKLTYNQQVTRTEVLPTLPAGTAAMTTGSLYRNGIEIDIAGVASSTPAHYACDFTNNSSYDQADDGQSIACNWLLWADVAAYLDWSGLRPMTALEFEKAGRGNQAPIPNEYAWGSTSITQATAINFSGANFEIAVPPGSNCNCSGTLDIAGPMRSGNFAQPATTRVLAGASYYGIMELSGNLYETSVTMGNTEGRAYTGQKGNGVLDFTGNANSIFWPLTASGFSGSGGSWATGSGSGRLSHRTGAAFSREYYVGGRGVRQFP
jgi:formylglycine-generating enzyme required for sulfatase activity